MGLAEWRDTVMAVYLRLLTRLTGLGRRLAAGEPGQSMVEYAIVAALIAVVAMAAVQALGGGISEVFGRILTHISTIG